jgi:dTDP-4-dehydrorhamnose 3,5-epimerase
MSSSWLLQGATKDGQTVSGEWQRVDQPLIDGVEVKEIRNVIKRNGHLTELFRRDWFDRCGEVGQVFQVVLMPGAISAWHAHAVTTDRLFVTHGTMRIVLYDGRDDSPTRGTVNEFLANGSRPALFVVPPRVWHAVQTVSGEPGIIVNMPNHAYCYEDPDHWRLPADTDEIPYRFS